MTYLFLVFSAILNGIAQLLWKIGLTGFDKILSFGEKINFLITNYYFIGGLFLYCISIILRFHVLSKLDASFAYPFIALSYIVVFTGGYFLGESIGIYRLLGIICILFGILLIAIKG